MSEITGEENLDFLYPEKWFDRQAENYRGPYHSSYALGKLIYEKFKPIKSLIDFGCGTCRFCNYMFEQGVIDNVAIDGSTFNEKFAKCQYVAHDLRTPFQSNHKFDMVTSWEVIEHLPEKSEDVIAKSIVDAADNIVLLSIDQGWGKHHVNCKSKGYWIKHFEKFGLIYLKDISKEISKAIYDDDKITGKGYGKNIMIFKVNKNEKDKMSSI